MRNRQTTYHEFLDMASTGERGRRATHAIFGQEAPSQDAEESLNAAEERFRHLLNGVLLFGTDEVKRAARELNVFYGDMLAQWWARLVRRGGRGFLSSPLMPFPSIACRNGIRHWTKCLRPCEEMLRQTNGAGLPNAERFRGSRPESQATALREAA